jgi:hypothetical protein
MTLRNLFALNAILDALFGLGVLIAPQAVLGLVLGAPIGPEGAFVARLYGALLLTIAIVMWAARQATGTVIARGIVLAQVLHNLIGLAVTVLYALSGQATPLAWAFVVVWALFALAYIYFLFAQPAAPAPARKL